VNIAARAMIHDNIEPSTTANTILISKLTIATPLSLQNKKATIF